MDVMTIVSVGAVLVLAYALWIWWKDGRSLHPFSERVCDRIRSALGVVSRDEVSVMHEQLQRIEQQWEPRLTRVEATTTFPSQLQHVSKEIERRLTNLERSDGPKQPSAIGRILRPRSIVRFGLRVTLSDGLWAHLGISRVEDIEDHLIDSLLQGPFCPVCLKRVVGRGRDKPSAVVPAQCRHCGVSWDSRGTLDSPLPLVALKRQVYDKLDQEYRESETIQPYGD